MQEIAEMHAHGGQLAAGPVGLPQRRPEERAATDGGEANFRELEFKFARSHLHRVAEQTAESIETSSLHLDVISDLKRLNSLFCATAYPVLEQAGVLNRSRLKEGDAPPAAPVPQAH